MDAEIKVSSAENPEISKILSVTPGVCPNIASYVSSVSRDFYLSNIYLPGPFSFIISNSLHFASAVLRCALGSFGCVGQPATPGHVLVVNSESVTRQLPVLRAHVLQEPQNRR